MNRIVLGALAALFMAAAGLFWWQGRAELQRGLAPPSLDAPASPAAGPIVLPSGDADGRRGAALPGTGRKVQSKEERRFSRFDRDRNGTISRVEMLSTRVKAFQKLDTNHDNLLSFEEWAVKTSNRFKEIDANGDGIVSRAELDAYYAKKDAKPKKPSCACGKAAPDKPGKPEAGSDRDDGEPGD